MESFNFGLDMRQLSTVVNNVPDLATMYATLTRAGIKEENISQAISIFTFFFRLNRITDWKDLGVIALDFMNNYGLNKTLQTTIFVQKFLQRTLSAFVASLPISTQSNVKEFHRKFKTYMNSSVATSLRDLLTTIMLFCGSFMYDVTHEDGSKTFFRDSNVFKLITKFSGPIRIRKISYVELVDAVLETTYSISNFITKFWYENKTLDEVFALDMKIKNWITKSKDLEVEQNNTYIALPVEGKISARTYYGNLVDEIAEANSLISLLPEGDSRRPELRLRRNVLQSIVYGLNGTLDSALRRMPMAIQVSGPPGTGKSVFLLHTAELHEKVMGRDFDPSCIYARQATEEYWSGYEPKSQPIIHYSEVGSKHKNIVKNQGDQVVDELLSVCDSLPYSCNMADLESKGKVFASPELILIDTNVSDMNLSELKNNPAAIKRRFIYVVPSVKKEYRQAGACQLDTDKVKMNPPKHKRDIWKIDVFREIPESNTMSTRKYLAKDIDIFEYTSLMTKLIKDHVKKQASADKAIAEDISTYMDEDFEQKSLAAESVPEDDESDVSFDSEFEAQWNENVTQSHVEQVFPLVRETSLSIFRQPWEIILRWLLAVLQYVIAQFMYYVFICTSPWMISYFVCFCSIPLVTYNMEHCYWIITFLKNSPFWNTVDYILYSLALYCIEIPIVKCAIPTSKFGVLKRYLTYRFHRAESIGFRTPLLSRMSFTIAEFATMIGIVYAAYKTTKYFTSVLSPDEVNLEGDVVMSSGDFSDEETTKEYLAKMQKKLNCQRPRKVPRPENAVDWDKEYVPIEVIGKSGVRSTDKPIEVQNRIYKNVRFLRIHGMHTTENHALGVCSSFCIVNKHALGKPGDNGTWTVESMMHPDSVQTRRCTIKPTDFEEFSGDLIMLNFTGELFTDLSNYLTTQRAKSMIGLKAVLEKVPVKAFFHGDIVANNEVIGQITQSNTYRYIYKNHRTGLCGHPLIVTAANKTFIQAVHCANQKGTSNCFAESFTKDEVLDAIKRLVKRSGMMPIVSQGVLRVPTVNGGITKTVDKRNPARFEDVPSLRIMGELDNFAMIRPRPSNLKESKLIDEVEPIVGSGPNRPDGQRKFVPPPMKARYVTNADGEKEYKAPYNEFMKKVSVHKKSLDSDIMLVVVDTLVKRITTKLRAAGVTKLQPLKLETAMNGDPDNFYMRSMKQSTSGGFVWPGPKSKHCESVDLDYNANSFMPDHEVTEQIAEIFACYEREEMAHPILGCQLKDEPRKNGKMTRVFTMSPVCNTIVHRMMLMPFYSLMVEHSDDVFSTSIGINMHSYDVDKFCKGFTEFSDKFMEGDYGGYDTSMPPDVTIMTNTIVYRVLKELGYNKEQLRIVRGILSDNLHPTLVLNGLLFSVAGLQPSGKYATAEDNSLKGNVLLMYYWICMMCKEGEHHPANAVTVYKPSDFWDYLHPQVYGDDMLTGVKDDVIDIINNCTYQKFCRVFYGMDYTDAQKSRDMQPYLSWPQTSFLKRNFVYRQDLGHWVAPIDVESIMKSISYLLPSKSVSPEVQVLQATGSALRELFFHHDEHTFMKKRAQLAELFARKYGFETDAILETYPTFFQLRSQIYPKDKL